MPWAWLTVMKKETMTTITGTVIAMAPGGHHHVHSDAEKKAVLNRLSPGHRASPVHQDHGGERPGLQ